MTRKNRSRPRKGWGQPTAEFSAPLPAGSNRFQPSQAYLDRTSTSQPSLNLTPATAPSSWPPAPPPPAHTTALTPAQPSKTAVWVQQQQRQVEERDRSLPIATFARAAKAAKVQAEYDRIHVPSLAEEPIETARRPTPPAPLQSSLSHTSSAHSSALYSDENDDEAQLYGDSPPPTLPFPQPQPPPFLAAEPAHDLPPTAPDDFIPLAGDSDFEDDSSDDELVAERLVGAAPALLDSEDELYGTGTRREVIIYDDTSEIGVEDGHLSTRDDTPDQPFDFDAQSSSSDEVGGEVNAEEARQLAEPEFRGVGDVEDVLGSPDEYAGRSSPKRQRLSPTDDKVEHQREGLVEEQGISSDDQSTVLTMQQRHEGTAPFAFSGLSRLLSLGLQQAEPSLASASTSSAVATPTAAAGSTMIAPLPRPGLLSRVFAKRRRSDDSLSTAFEPRAPTASSSSARSSAPAPPSHPTPEALAPSCAHSTSALSNVASLAPFAAATDAAAAPTAVDVPRPATAPVSIRPIAMPRARERATYQRRVDLSSTPLVADTAVRDDRGKVTYRPSPVQPAPIHQPLAANGKSVYVRSTILPAQTTAVAPTTSAPSQAPPTSRRAAKSTHPRDPNKPPGQLPLTPFEKAHSLPDKLRAAFPLEFPSALSASSVSLFLPATHLATASAKSLAPPSKNALFGFWPAPPTLTSGKGAWPPPAAPSSSADDLRPPAHIFIDNSNVLYAFLNWVRARPEAKLMSYLGIDAAGRPKTTKTVTLAGRKVKLDYAVLFGLLERGRRVEKRCVVASSTLWQGLEAAVDWGYEISLLQRVPRPVNAALSTSAPSAAQPLVAGKRKSGALSSGKAVGAPQAADKQPKAYKEQAVDELLHLKILESLLDSSPSRSPSSTPPSPPAPRPILVLVTGDANSSEYNPTGFLGCVKRALARGWDVEIVSFAEGTSGSWRAAAELGEGEGRGKLRVVELEKFGEELVL